VSTRSQQRRDRRISTRPAPYGVRPPTMRFEKRPDGWHPIHPSMSQRAFNAFDHSALRAADAAARRLTRRSFLERAARLGLFMGLAVNSVVSGSRSSLAHGPGCNAVDPSADNDPCGPSPLCGTHHCRGDGQCDVSDPGVKRRGPWPDSIGNCAADDAPNTWTEHCCRDNIQPNPGHWKCCDCCTNENGSPICPDAYCPGDEDKFRCICRNNEHGCP